MDEIRKRLVRILKSRINQDLIKQIEDQLDSPLNYACRNLDKEMPEGNDLDHSCEVLKNCIAIISESALEIASNGYLSLLYASLLHDVAKSNNRAIGSEINDVLKENCELFLSEKSNHGIRSAHYIDKKRKTKETEQRIILYGLESPEVRQLLNIIAFHHSGRMHPCFLPSKLQREELLLCLIFWLADIADALYSRARIPQSVRRKYRSDKNEARGRVIRVLIKKNVIIWRAEEQIPELEQAKNMANSELSKHRLLLQAFRLPNRIICLQKRERTPKEDLYASHDDIVSANLCFDVSGRPTTPLVLSANTLPELYEELVEASYKLSVSEKLSPDNYFGPVVLEVKNVENDKADEINIRSKTGKSFSLVEEYTDSWLSSEQIEADKFYFGYTHGQRIWKYLYPCSTKDLNAALADPMRFKEWEGQLDQFEHIVEILEEGPQARRAYVVIPHLMIDNPKSKFGIKDEKAPALIAIQFMIEEIEKEHKLSGFALLRAQELSTFFVVNYLEVRRLVMKLIPRLRNKFPSIKAGRIVMLSAFGYFEPYTVLLDKPQICQLTETQCQECVSELDRRKVRKQFIELLHEFKKDYHKIDTKWCEKVGKYLDEAKYEQKNKVIEGIRKLKEDLDKLEKERGGHSITSEIRLRKEETVDQFIEILKKAFE